MKNSLLITGLMVGVAFSGSAWASACQTCEASYSFFQVKSCECDNAGHVVEMVEGYPMGNEWFMINKTTYDAAGHATSTIAYGSENDYNHNTPGYKSIYTYDAAGHQTSSTSYNSADAVANNTPTSQTSYTNDAVITQSCSATSCITTANDREISRTNYSNGVPSKRTDYTYDAQGRVTSEIRYKSSQSITDESPDMQIMTLRNDSGQVTSFTIYGRNHVPIGAIVYTYDENGNKIYETEYGAGAAYLDEPDPNFPFDPNKPLYQRRYPIGQNYFLKDDCSKKSCQDYPWTEPQVPCTLGHIPGCIGDGVGVEVFPINYSTQIVCAYGNVSGCVGDTVQLADGTSAMMQNGQIFNQFSDGSTTLYNADGTIKGYKGKRIYTVEEATKVSGERNTFRIRYK